MNNRRAIFFLFLVTVAAVVANILLSFYAPTNRAAAQTTLLELSAAPTRVSIARESGSVLELVKTDSWRLLKPYAGPVDEKVVLKVVDALLVAEATDVLTPADLVSRNRRLADFGLEKPSLTVTIGNERESASIAFGSLTPTTNSVYAVVDDSGSVYVLPLTVLGSVDRQPKDFRRTDIFAYGPESVLSFDVRRAGTPVLSFVREGKGWKTGNRLASDARVNDLLALAADLQAQEFVWPSLASNATENLSVPLLSGYGLDPETAVTLAFRCTDGTDRSISFGNAAGEHTVYALVHDGGEIVTVDAAIRDAAVQDPIRFTDWRVFPIKESEVRNFTLQVGDSSYILARTEEGGWRMDAPVSAPADAELAQQVVERILALTDSDLVDGGAIVSVNTNPAPRSVSAELLLGKRRLEELRSRDVLKIDPLVVRRLVSSSAVPSNVTVSVVYARDRRAWNLEAEKSDGEVKNSAVQRVLAALSPLRAEKIVTLTPTAADFAKFGLENPFHTLAVDQEKEGAVRRNILIGAQTEGGRYATVGSSDGVFVLSETVVRQLTSDLLEN